MVTFCGPLEDRLAIRELIDAYADAVTRRDADDWADCWCEEAEWSLPDLPDVGTVSGRTAIVALWTAAMAQFPGLVFRAWPGSIVVDAETAVVRSYTSETFEHAGGAVTVLGSYEDTCLKCSGGWKFSRRQFRRLGSGN